MDVTRRAALAALGAAALAGLPAHAAWGEATDEFIGAAQDAAGVFRISGLDGFLNESLGASAPLRLHALSLRPDSAEAVAIARRPGDVGLVFDGRGRALRATFRATDGRRFSGHGAYRDGGATFLTSEIDAVTGEGFVVLRDAAAGYAARSELRSAGVGPHDVVGVGRLVAVANGAKEPKTNPGVAALGRTGARSNVALIDPLSGTVEQIVETDADLSTLSLRHIVSAPQGLLVAAQDTEAGARDKPLVAWIERDRLRWLDAEPEIAGRMGGSVCSLVLDRSGRYAAASCPKGGVVVVYDLEAGAAVGLAPAADVCGLGADARAGGFVATTGLGEVLRIAAHDDGVAIVDRRIGALRWDNHLAQRPLS